VPERRLLDATRLFAALPEEVRAGLRAQLETREYARGEILFRQGDPATEMFVVLDGRIAIATQSGDGREAVVAVLERGGLFGELAIFDDAPRSADGRALTEASVAVLPYEAIRDALRDRPELLWVMVRLLAERLRATDESLADAVFLDVPARTAKRLLELADGEDQFTIPLTQEELASMIGASRERVNKALALFARLGWLELEGRGQYKILDRQSLEDRATL
jgi:CRP/FNR family transcriptional regulator, cyclic AMP receptor protein